ncbi:MAG: bifunctional folylpolyglutamate synthase/dihydrofolate synthase [Chloroflexi bacterium]|nr:bifunctional folylpolyglutamate synthase/dihydrofolate synthase [Chloroflexota bacterium]
MPSVTTYQEALDYLYRFIYESKQRPHPSLNLTRTNQLLDAFDNPHLQFDSVVVAGTKGKGSTSAMIANIARHAGFRVGLWTSPHLHSFRERIQVNGEMISQASLIDYVNRIAPVVDEIDPDAGFPATFAISFAIAMRYFADCEVDLVVAEVGLGGRFDSANVLTPILSVITSISYDHMDLLGTTIDEIAMQKGGIAKANVPMIVAPQPYAALVTVAACAAEAGAPVIVVDDPGSGGIRGYDDADDRVRGPIPEIYDPYDSYLGSHQSRLNGEFQSENTRLAIAAVLMMQKHGLVISDEAIVAGISTVEWPGRFELSTVGRVPVLFDGAHNVDSAHRLVASIRQQFAGRPITMIIGCSKDKEVEKMVPVMASIADQVIVTASRHPRAWRDLGALRDIVVHQRPDIQVVGIDDPSDALKFALHHAVADEIIVITGSLFVVAAGREALGIAKEVD